ncbi:MAG: S-layer homology domain-containing protein [Actinomycetia bacterium]|nr:S-layer homology domain-containing protein [Actinomycetes bacterium]
MLVSFVAMKTKSLRFKRPRFSKVLRMSGLGLAATAAVSVVLLVSPHVAGAWAAGFSDVPESHPYHVQIETLAQLGIIDGYADGTFRPEAQITRQQFAKMVILAMRISVSEDDKCAFVDVKKSSDTELYPDNYIAAAVRENIVTGYPGPAGAAFKPGAPITLAQMVTMGTRSCERPLYVPPDSYKSAWGNFDKVHSLIARVAQYNGLLRELAPPGKNLKSLSPWSKATRGQGAALLFNVMGTDMSGLNGRFLGDSTDLVRYFRAQTGGNDGRFSVSLEELAKLYVKYGKRFGIRADMAWAQMIHETGYGQYGGDVLPEQNNFAGIGATGGVPGHSFATAELGVIAQYAHLAWYVYPDHVSDPYCVLVPQPADGSPISTPGDPRHYVQDSGAVHKGNVRTVYDLSGKWAPGANYGSAIQTRVKDMVDKGFVTCGLW